MGKEIHRRVRATRHVAPLSVPLDRTTLSVDWRRVLLSLRRAHQVKLTKAKKVTLVPVEASIVQQVASVDTGEPGKRSPVQLRRLLHNIKFTGVTGRVQGRIDHLVRAFRAFLINASNIEITRWWKRIHRLLPEPIFFVVYATLKAVL